MRRLLFVPAAILAFAACAGDEPRTSDAGGPPPPPYNDSTMPPADAPPSSEARPSTRTDTMLLEGTPEPVELTLFDSGARLTPAFSTYVPADMVFEWRRAPQGEGVDFMANFGGVREPDARFAYFVYSADTNRAQVNQYVLDFVAGRKAPDQPAPTTRFPWALMEMRYRYDQDGRTITGTIGVGQRDNRFFHILVQYPVEYGDGMGPRVAQLIEHWRWADGTPLPF